jgi:hypothetical protein
VTKSYAITLYVDLESAETLWETAKKALTVHQLEAASVEEYIGTREDPSIEECFRAIYDRNPKKPAGYTVEGAIFVEDITEHVSEDASAEVDPDEPIILVISDETVSAWENLERQNPELAKAILDLHAEGHQGYDGAVPLDVFLREDMMERTPEEVQEFITEFQAPPPR